MLLERIIVIDEICVCNFEPELKSSEQGLEGKKFPVATKMPAPSFEGETNDDNGLQLLYLV